MVETVHVRASPLCSVCGRVAASVELLPEGSSDGRALSGPTLRVDGFLGDHRTPIGGGRGAGLTRAIGAEDWRALHALDLEYAPFYCPPCGLVYCAGEWQVQLVFDDDDPGFLDCMNGTCPRGHARMLFD